HLPALFGRRDFELAEDCAGDADRGTPRDLVLGVERVRITRHRIDDRHARPGAGESDSRVPASAVRLGGEQPEVALFFAARPPFAVAITAAGRLLVDAVAGGQRPRP